MTNKIILFVFILLATLNNALAYQNDPEVFQISHDNSRIACAEIDEEYAYCWEPSKNKILKLQTDQSERQKLQQNFGIYCHEENHCCDLNDSKLYISTLKKLTVRMLDYDNYDSNYSKNRRAKVRAIGATIYMCHGHEKMVEICESLPKERGIRRLVESLWNGIGRWFG